MHPAGFKRFAARIQAALLTAYCQQRRSNRGSWLAPHTAATQGGRVNTTLIEQTAEATAAGTVTFPTVVQNLLAAGVEYYHIDYIQHLQTCYSGADEIHVTPLAFDVPAVAENFDTTALVAAIRDSQLRGQKFPDFSIRAVQSGVQGYTVFLRGKRVIYQGRQGDQHTEWFPGAAPQP